MVSLPFLKLKFWVKVWDRAPLGARPSPVLVDLIFQLAKGRDFAPPRLAPSIRFAAFQPRINFGFDPAHSARADVYLQGKFILCHKRINAASRKARALLNGLSPQYNVCHFGPFFVQYVPLWCR
jgi:hypothetical protein